MISLVSSCLLFALFLIPDIQGHKMGTGACPQHAGMPNFNMDKFLGSWYVIQKIDSRSPCQRIHLSKNGDGSFNLVEVRKPYALDFVGIGTFFNHTATLDVPDPLKPANLRAKFTYNPAGKSDFVILETDYTNFAVIFECQKVLFTHRYSASILSRTSSMNSKDLDKMKTFLISKGISTIDFYWVRQDQCQISEDDVRISLDDTVSFNPGAISSVLDRIGQTISNVRDTVESTLRSRFETLGLSLGTTETTPGTTFDFNGEKSTTPTLKVTSVPLPFTRYSPITPERRETTTETVPFLVPVDLDKFMLDIDNLNEIDSGDVHVIVDKV